MSAESRRGFPATTWVSPKLEIRASTIQGRGLFAAESIEVGEPVIVVGGRVLSDAGLRAVMARGVKYSSIAVGDGLHLLLDSPTDAEYGNHSCDANTWMCDEVTTCARRRIDVGEEITIDYATQTGIPGWSMICNCGAAPCRREITGNDWQLRDVQERYRDHFAPFLNERIRDRAERGVI